MDDIPRVSVLLPTRGRPNDLQRCVRTILESDHPSFELIVIEQGGELTVLPAEPRVRHLRSQTAGKSAALNEALALATGDILAFTDDDCTVPPDWLTRGERRLTEYPELGLVFGSLEAFEHDRTEIFVPEFRPKAFEVVRTGAGALLRGGAGANIFMRRSVLENLGGFDDRIGPGAEFKSCEEFDVYYRALRAGFSVGRDPDNPVTHWGGRAYADGTGQRLLRGYYFGEGVVLGKHVRCGDRTAMRLSARIALEHSLTTIESMWKSRSPRGLAKSGYWLRGFVTGLSTSVDREARMFR